MKKNNNNVSAVRKMLHFFLSWVWLALWLVSAAVMIIIFIITPNDGDGKTNVAVIIMATFALIPLRILFYKGVEWGVDFKSRDPGFKKNLLSFGNL